MLTGLRIYTSDQIWRQILTDLNATVVDAPSATDLNMDDMDIPCPVNMLQLRSLLLAAADNSGIITRVFGRPVSLPRLQTQIVVALYKSGGMTSPQLKNALGYAADTSTHTVDTAIYNLRKVYGRDFIINKNGIYTLGGI
ncbi:MAG: helix-turn-helix domain-containing protein [Alphaproteobacteria bacterium]|nr:helix-turn-helix domain-containing protein [Alphaproteobacteria bacterium]MBR2341862.1 helix-turn-helix domain-containing protein [Alphaproteobacteria bacterium]MBR2482360.1 helix-turn-helix domain-containing protein [Alphaproteobacteria bacterium]